MNWPSLAFIASWPPSFDAGFFVSLDDMSAQLLDEILGAVRDLRLARVVRRGAHLPSNVVRLNRLRLDRKLLRRVFLELLDLVALVMGLQLAAAGVVLDRAARLGLLPLRRVGVDFERGHQISVSREIFLRLLTVGRRAVDAASRIGRDPF